MQARARQRAIMLDGFRPLPPHSLHYEAAAAAAAVVADIASAGRLTNVQC